MREKECSWLHPQTLAADSLALAVQLLIALVSFISRLSHWHLGPLGSFVKGRRASQQLLEMPKCWFLCWLTACSPLSWNPRGRQFLPRAFVLLCHRRAQSHHMTAHCAFSFQFLAHFLPLNIFMDSFCLWRWLLIIRPAREFYALCSVNYVSECKLFTLRLGNRSPWNI